MKTNKLSWEEKASIRKKEREHLRETNRLFDQALAECGRKTPRGEELEDFLCKFKSCHFCRHQIVPGKETFFRLEDDVKVAACPKCITEREPAEIILESYQSRLF